MCLQIYSQELFCSFVGLGSGHILIVSVCAFGWRYRDGLFTHISYIWQLKIYLSLHKCCILQTTWCFTLRLPFAFFVLFSAWERLMMMMCAGSRETHCHLLLMEDKHKPAVCVWHWVNFMWGSRQEERTLNSLPLTSVKMSNVHRSEKLLFEMILPSHTQCC